MKKLFLFVLPFLLLQERSSAGVTPADQAIPEGKSATVTCEYNGDEKFNSIGHKDVPAKGEYHYDVYLPKGYEMEKGKAYPVLFVMMPGGNAKLMRLNEDLERLKWIGISLQEAKNGPWEPITGNFLAAHDDAVKRFRIQEGMKFATGFSGGARGSSLFTQMRPGFRGLILQGAGFWYEKEGAGGYGVKGVPKQNFRVYMLVGKDDGNRSEIPLLKKALPSGVKFKTEQFDGKHQPAPVELVSKALDWVSGTEE